MLQAVLELQVAAFGPSKPLVAGTLDELANVLKDQGDLRQAQNLLERSLAIKEKAFGESSEAIVSTLNDLGDVYTRAGRTAEAEKTFNRALEIQRAVAESGRLEIENLNIPEFRIVLSESKQKPIRNIVLNPGDSQVLVLVPGVYQIKTVGRCQTDTPIEVKRHTINLQKGVTQQMQWVCKPGFPR